MQQLFALWKEFLCSDNQSFIEHCVSVTLCMCFCVCVCECEREREMEREHTVYVCMHAFSMPQVCDVSYMFRPEISC